MSQLMRAGRPIGVALVTLLLIAGGALAGNAMLSQRHGSNDGSQIGAPAGLESPEASEAAETAEPTESPEASEAAETAEPTESAEPGDDNDNDGAEADDDNGVDASPEASDDHGGSSDDSGTDDGSGGGTSGSSSGDDGSGHH